MELRETGSIFEEIMSPLVFDLGVVLAAPSVLECAIVMLIQTKPHTHTHTIFKRHKYEMRITGRELREGQCNIIVMIERVE